MISSEDTMDKLMDCFTPPGRSFSKPEAFARRQVAELKKEIDHLAHELGRREMDHLKAVETERHLRGVIQLLKLFAARTTLEQYLESVLFLVKKWCGCQCVGVRLADAQGRMPFAAQLGFDPQFVEHAASLSLTESACACVRALTGRLEREGVGGTTSQEGSFFCGAANHRTVAMRSDLQDCACVSCASAGYASIAHAPIRNRDQLIGSIHLADTELNKFRFESITFVESIAPLIGEAVHRFRVEQSLQEVREEILDISRRERQRVGQDLHDSLGGLLSGTALLSKALAQKLRARSLPEADMAQEITDCISTAISQTRAIARGLCPLELEGVGLIAGLEHFVAETQARFRIGCALHADLGLEVKDRSVAAHLFRIVQEAVSNAVRHGNARSVEIYLAWVKDQLHLEIRDDGVGLPQPVPVNKGIGLRTMKYRADIIGAQLRLTPGKAGGTVVSCVVPMRGEKNSPQAQAASR